MNGLLLLTLPLWIGPLLADGRSAADYQVPRRASPEDPNEEVLSLPLIGPVRAEALALPALTVILAGCDSLNPAAFLTLFLLLGLLHEAQDRARLFLIGTIFVLFSGLAYFLLMAVWLQIFLLVGELRVVTLLAGAITVGLAGTTLKSYFRRTREGGQPEEGETRLREQLRRLARPTSLAAVLLGTATLALTINAYELLCTPGFPLVFVRLLTLRHLPASSYYLYLAIYNVIYVTPLLLILVAFSLTLGRHPAGEGRALKLLSALMMLGLGLVLLASPGLLHHVGTAPGLLAAALLLTVLISHFGPVPPPLASPREPSPAGQI